MMKLTSRDTEGLIEEYFKESGNQFNLPYQDFMNICKAPFNYFASIMRTPGVHTILIKYLGKFAMYNSRVIYKLRTYNFMLNSGKLPQEDYDREIPPLLKHIEDNPDDFKMKNNLVINKSWKDHGQKSE